MSDFIGVSCEFVSCDDNKFFFSSYRAEINLCSCKFVSQDLDLQVNLNLYPHEIQSRY